MSKETLTNALMKRADQVKNSTEILLQQTTDWQVIKQYLSNRLHESQLTATQEEKLKRYQYIYNQLVGNRYSEREVINQVMKFFKVKDAQAYEDLNSTREIFSTVFNMNKLFEQKMALEAAKDGERRCKEIGDSKGEAAFQKNRIALANAIETVEDNPADLFTGHKIEFTFDPSILSDVKVDMNEVLKAVNEKRKVPIKIDMFEELNFTEDGS